MTFASYNSINALLDLLAFSAKLCTVRMFVVSLAQKFESHRYLTAVLNGSVYMRSYICQYVYIAMCMYMYICTYVPKHACSRASFTNVIITYYMFLK